MKQSILYNQFLEKIVLKTLDNWKAVSVISFFIFSFLFSYINITFDWSSFTERDISRAKAWLNGSFYWPGPEMSGGSNLPGPFFYFLLFPAILMGDNTYSQAALWTILWFSLVYTLAFFFLSKIISHKESLLVFLITFTATQNRYIHSYMLNPEFAVMFHLLALITLYYWREKRNSLYLYLTGLIIALGIQIHLLTALHIITVLLFYIIDKRLIAGKDKSKNIKALLLFLCLALSPIFIFTLLNRFHFVDTSETAYTKHAGWILKEVFSEQWMKHINLTVVPFIILFTFYAALNLTQNIKLRKKKRDSSLENLFFITAVPCLSACLIGIYSWYLLFIPVFSTLFISKGMDCLITKDKKRLSFFSYSLLTFLYVLFFNTDYIDSLFLFTRNTFALMLFLFSILILLTFNLPWHKKSLYKNIFFYVLFFLLIKLNISDFKQPFRFSQINFNQKKRIFRLNKTFDRSFPSHKQLYPIMKRIYLETNWPPKTAMKKIRTIGLHPEKSLLSDYSITVERLHAPVLSLLYDKKLDDLNPHFINNKYENKAQAYFIIQHLQKFIDWTQDDWKNYLAHSSLLSHVLKQEIKAGKIIIREPELYKKYWLIPYNITKDSLFPEGGHNIGQPYYWEEPEWLKTCHETKKFKNKTGFFYCRVRPGHLQRAGLHIQFIEDFLNIQFFGPVLGTGIKSMNLHGVSLWSEGKITIMYGLKSNSYSLPDVGTLTADGKNPEKTAKRFLAPLKMKILLKDWNKKDKFKIKLSFVETYNYYPPKTITVEWN